MSHLELCARNVSAALREAMNAQNAFMMHIHVTCPIDWAKLKKQSSIDHQLLRNLVAAVEYLGTVQHSLKSRACGIDLPR